MASTFHTFPRPTEKPRRLTISQALELALTRNTGPRNVVQLDMTATGDVLPKVTATHDDLAVAERMALASMSRLRDAFPLAPRNGEEPLKVGLTRNAKGETQISVDGRGGAVVEEYETLRARYPLMDGTVSHDKPKAKP